MKNIHTGRALKPLGLSDKMALDLKLYEIQRF